MLYPPRILCFVFALSLFLIFFNNRVYAGVVRANLPSRSCLLILLIYA